VECDRRAEGYAIGGGRRKIRDFGIVPCEWDFWGVLMLVARSSAARGSELLERLAAARVRTDELFDLVRSDALYDRPIPERHRIIFYLGHLEAFDWNLLRERLVDEKAFHPQLDQLFAFGIDPVGGGLPADQPADWPSLKEVRHYTGHIRQTLDAAVEGVLDSASESMPRSGEFPARVLLNVAIEHRLMHAETLAYMLHRLPLERKLRKAPRLELVAQPVEARMIEIPAGSATLGLSRNDPTFGWDNEYEQCAVAVPAFLIDQHKVTNRQYLQFMVAGGYENPIFWSEADWAWRTQHDITHPAFWSQSGDHQSGDHQSDDQWYYQTMFDLVPLPLDWPAYVSHAEASAYARWAGKSLPTEAHWHRAAYGSPGDSERPYPWGTEAPGLRHGNFDFQRWDPAPAAGGPEGRSAFGVADLVGNGWEWTSSLFEPFPAFEPFPFYPGYSANFFDGKHYVLKGGSARTAACMLRRSFRNWFQPHYQYVYSGFRCVSR
jgi:iron(II)-dependent oxidoreductase